MMAFSTENLHSILETWQDSLTRLYYLSHVACALSSGSEISDLGWPWTAIKHFV